MFVDEFLRFVGSSVEKILSQSQLGAVSLPRQANIPESKSSVVLKNMARSEKYKSTDVCSPPLNQKRDWLLVTLKP